MMQSKYTNYERTTYEELKRSFLNDAFSACRAKFHNGQIRSWSNNETEWGYASYNFEGCLNLPIEQLMLNIIEIITYSGQFTQAHKICLQKINTI